MIRVALNWRNVTPSNSPKFLVRGTELNVALCGHLSRFQICETRSYDRVSREYDRIYVVRDAHAINDENVRSGKRPPIVARFATLDEAEAFCWNDGG